MRRIGALVLILAGCLFGLAAAEVVIRVSGLGRQFTTPDAVIGYRLTPEFGRTLREWGDTELELHLSTNNLGLRRDGDTPIEKPADSVRVLVLGDSQTEGIVENVDGYPAVLERGLREDAPVEVLNAGVSGYSPLLEYLWFREWGVRLRPDIVVLALYTGNDLGELTAREGNFAGLGPWNRLATLAPDGKGGWSILPPGAPQTLAEADSWLRAHSRAYDLVRSRMRGPSGDRVETVVAAAQVCPGCLQALWQEWLSQERPEEYATAGLQLRNVLRRFIALAAEVGAHPVALLLPTKLDVEPETVRESVEAAKQTLELRDDPASFTQAVRTQMLAACAAENLEVHDLLPALREAHAQAGRPLYWVIDWHLNPAGNEVVAKAIATRLGALARDRRAR